MANVNQTPTKSETVMTYLVLAVLAGIIFVCGWMVYSSWNSWILF